MTFEWDEEKERHNIQAHDGITFSYAARVFLETGESQFDRFSSTVFAMQTLSRGLDMKPELEQLSLELLDPFVELRRQGRVTRPNASAKVMPSPNSCSSCRTSV